MKISTEHANQSSINCQPISLHNTNYAHSTQPKKSTIAHFPTSKERDEALNIIKWCVAIPQIRADSPRFPYYVSRWDVPGKIAAARAACTLDALLKDCPPIDPSWIRFVPAALEQHREFMAKTRPAKPATNSRESSPRLRRVV